MISYGYIIGFGLYVLLVILTLPVFIHRRNHEPIRSRGWGLTLASFAGGIVYFFFSAFGAAFSDNQVLSCHFVLWPGVAFLPSWIVPIFMRCYILYYKDSWNKKQISENTKDFKALLDGWQSKAKVSTTLTFMFTIYFTFIAINLLIGMAIYLSEEKIVDFRLGVAECFREELNLIIFQASFLIVLMIGAVILLWNTTDRFQFKSELKMKLIVSIPLFIIWVIWRNTNLIDSNINTDLCVFILVTLHYIVSVVFPLYMSYGDRWIEGVYGISRSRSEGSMDGEDVFLSCIRNQDLLLDLKDFMVRTWCVENLNFYLECEKYRIIDPSQKDQALTLAQSIVEMYISESAICQVNIDSITRKEIIQALSSKNITPTLFQKASQIVFDQMRLGTFLDWKKTPGFQKKYKQMKNLRRKSSSKRNSQYTEDSSLSLEILSTSH